MDTTTFAQKIKQKYPAYQSVDDNVLVSKFVEKYPVYKSQITEEKTPFLSSSKLGQSAGQVFGAEKGIKEFNTASKEYEDVASNLTKAIGNAKKLGQDTTRLETALAQHQQEAPNLDNFIGNKAKTLMEATPGKATEMIAGEALGTVLEATSGGILSGGAKAVTAGGVKALAKEGAIVGGAYGSLGGAATGMQEGKNVGGVLKDAAIGGATGAVLGGATGGLIGAVPSVITGIQKIPGLSKTFAGVAKENIVPKAESIMNRVARVKPNEARAFEDMSGKTIGKYLVETGNFGTPDNIVAKEAQKFAKSVADVDKAFDSLPGTYKPQEVIDVLESSVERLGKVKSKEVKRATELLNKAKAEGLNMAEINEAKRLFERNVKLAYNKAINPDQVALATNMDNALREWQFAQADMLGFSNIGEMNLQTRMSKHIVNSLGGKIVDNALLNGISLSDWIMLSGGNPAAVGGLLTKRLFSDPGVQAKIAKMLTNVEAKGAIVPKIGETKFLRLEAGKTKIPTTSGGSTIPVAPKGSNIEFTGQAGGVTSAKPTQQPLLKKSLKKSSSKVSNKSSTKSNSLSTEAKKYKSAEEFVKAQPTVYRGEGGSNVAQGKALLAEGKHYASDAEYPKGFGKVGEYTIKPNAKVLDLGDSTFAEVSQKLGIPERSYISPKELSSIAKENGYDVLKYDGSYKSTGKTFNHTVDLTGDSYIPKSQLTDIWKKANKKK